MVNYTETASGPVDYSWAVTPDDDNDMVRPSRSVLATGAGVVMWNNLNGELQTTTFAAGERVPIKAKRILATGTTATGLEGIA